MTRSARIRVHPRFKKKLEENKKRLEDKLGRKIPTADYTKMIRVIPPIFIKDKKKKIILIDI